MSFSFFRTGCQTHMMHIASMFVYLNSMLMWTMIDFPCTLFDDISFVMHKAITCRLTFKYICTNHLSKNNKGCAFVGKKYQTTKVKTTTEQLLQMFVIHFCQPKFLCSFVN